MITHTLTLTSRTDPNLTWTKQFLDPGENAQSEGTLANMHSYSLRILHAFNEIGFTHSYSKIGLVPSLLIPVRMNKLSDFAKDFFFPTLANRALKIQGTIRRVLASVAALFIDLCTLPLRFLTALPWAVVLHRSPEHPFHQVMSTFFSGVAVANRQTPIDPKWLKEDGVYVDLTSQNAEGHIVGSVSRKTFLFTYVPG